MIYCLVLVVVLVIGDTPIHVVPIVIITRIPPHLIELESFIILLHLVHLLLSIPVIILIVQATIRLVLEHSLRSEHELGETILQVGSYQHWACLLYEIDVLCAVEGVVFYCDGDAGTLELLLHHRQ